VGVIVPVGVEVVVGVADGMAVTEGVLVGVGVKGAKQKDWKRGVAVKSTGELRVHCTSRYEDVTG